MLNFIRLFKFEKSGGSVYPRKISPKYCDESLNNSLKFISKSIIVKVSAATNDIINKCSSR